MAYHSEKKLYRDTDSGMIGGVCAGLSEYLRFDVTLLRIIFAVLSLGWGSGVILYIILWIILPEKNTFQ
ncbi:PspC domain-containing protein [Erysipelothrix sp. HDW6A]|uniref:PspC domain-containing protein n=1 Tax=Erysipelothrix sp. HDW6A TaxID=2714928 RepID=UPI00140C5911|nr:PspC domain-containing protein [Erysipelothrix sp. HDW6A]QIK56774.1 PspC domain-containing protein [Erysipelothrix sp. HDW6A]